MAGSGCASTRERLVAAAVEHLEEEGLAAFSLREVARRAGVSHAAPVRHFDSKAALLTEVATNGFEDLTELLRHAARSIAANDSDQTKRYVAVGTAYITFARTRPELFALMCFHDDPRRPGRLDSVRRSTFRRMAEWCGGLASDDVADWCGIHGLALVVSSGAAPSLTETDVRTALLRQAILSNESPSPQR